MRRYFAVGTFAALLAIIYSACAPESAQQESKDISEPVMRKVSDLVKLMFTMEADIKSIRTGLVEDSSFAQLQGLSHGGIFTAEPSKDILKDSVFVAKATAYLGHIEKLTKAESKESALTHYSDVINTCVSCHQDYCPGPVARIKKLRI